MSGSSYASLPPKKEHVEIRYKICKLCAASKLPGGPTDDVDDHPCTCMLSKA